MRRRRGVPRQPLEELPGRTIVVGRQTVELRVRRSRTARAARLTVAPRRPIDLVLPRGAGPADVERILREKRAWLERSVAWALAPHAEPRLGLDRPDVVWIGGSPIPVRRVLASRSVALDRGGRLEVGGPDPAGRPRALVPAPSPCRADRRRRTLGAGPRRPAGTDPDGRRPNKVGLLWGGRTPVVLVAAGPRSAERPGVRGRPRAVSPPPSQPLAPVLEGGRDGAPGRPVPAGVASGARRRAARLPGGRCDPGAPVREAGRRPGPRAPRTAPDEDPR